MFYSPLFQENQHWNELIQDAQKRGAIIKTSDPHYRHDAMKILKLKPVLQRSLTHPPATAPEAPRPQGGLPSNKLDSGLAKTPSAASLYHTSSDTVTSKEPERTPQDRLRDPRLLRRLDAESKGTSLKDPQSVGSHFLDPNFLWDHPWLSLLLWVATGHLYRLSHHLLTLLLLPQVRGSTVARTLGSVTEESLGPLVKKKGVAL